ncbi:MAG: ATP-binding cassette domain-containing protein [Rickettsiales bacterium]|nr:ATP-binding cassette domain-containing protein [Rickettsiales bacterium]
MKKQKTNTTPLLTLQNICYSTKTLSEQEIAILENINLNIPHNCFTGIIGKSGSGKTTLLKIISSLLEPTSGTIKTYHKKPLKISIAFQDYSLLPWLNTYENIALGIDSLKISEQERSTRVSEIISLMSLNGFEESYPKELSAGMKQRVNLARALIIEPDILLLDEPFSNLDPLTTDTLKSDLNTMWRTQMIKINSIILITHNTDDIIDLCDEIYTIGKHPAQIIGYTKLDAPFPRKKNSKIYNTFIEKIFESLSKDIEISLNIKHTKRDYKKYLDIANVTPNAVIGLLNYLVITKKSEKIDIQDIIENTNISSDTILPILEFARIIDFIKIKDTSVSTTTFGRVFMIDKTKRVSILRRNLEKHIGLIEDIKKHYPNNLQKIYNTISKQISAPEGTKIIKTLITWSKYAKII